MKTNKRVTGFIIVAALLIFQASSVADTDSRVLARVVSMLVLDEDRIDALSQSAAAPGTFIVISDSSIIKDQPLAIRFSNSLGFDLQISTRPLEDGEVAIPVPIYRNPATDEFAQGEVTITLPNGDEAPFTLLDLPNLPGSSSQGVLQAFLESHRANFVEYLGVLNELKTRNGYDADDDIALIEGKIAGLDVEIHDLANQGTLFYDATGEGMNSEELSLYARMIYAMSKGLVDELERLKAVDASSASQAAAPATFYLEPLSKTDLTEEEIRRAFDWRTSGAWHSWGDTATSGSTRAMSHVSFLQSNARRYGGKWGEDKFNSTVGVRARATPKLLSGSLHTVGNLLHSAESGESFVIHHSLAEGLQDIKDDLLPQEVQEFLDMYQKMDKARRWAARNCSKGIFIFGYRLTCNSLSNTRIEDTYEYSRLSFIRFDPYRSESGAEGKLKLLVTAQDYVDNPATSNTLTIDWKDGPPQVIGLTATPSDPLAAYGYVEVPHTYTLGSTDPKEKSFMIETSVVGNNYKNVDTKLTQAVVQQNIDPLYAEFVEAPNCLDTNQAGVWRIGISGALKPYQVIINWGDKSRPDADYTSRSGYQADHTYAAPSVYTVWVKVLSDSKVGNAEYTIITTTVRVENSCASDLPSISVTATDSEAEETGDTGTFTLTRTGPTNTTLGAAFTMSGSAELSTDYTLDGTADFPRGSSTVDINLLPVDDLNVEGTESATLTLLPGQQHIAGTPAFAHILIRDADVHACADGSISYTHSEYRCARFWGCDSTVRFIKNGNLICRTNSYEEITGGSIDYYTCSSPHFRDCSLQSSTPIESREDNENGFTLVWNNGGNWMHVEEL